ncbi:choline dehydrogenase, mitochondrial-like [Galendromus occidentalis]|uniref:Choline dehydrogenase, mitochondrial-like n=1 Tax=Galendromus occidentalis TaxID=34638 RepID=A0AAJ6VY88_9ACAR|nr:choline dehydrogenase, mitochondrial-like [Galendromus occidentalis]
MSFLSGLWNSIDEFTFRRLIQPSFDLALSIDADKLPTLIIQAITALVGLLGIFSGQNSVEFFRPRVPLTAPSELFPSYDFIVVGGGISGCLVAKRLSEAGHTTLLIHGPGTLPNTLSRVPLLNYGYLGHPDHDHSYKGPKLNSRWGNQTLLYNSGKDLGGSQLLSAQMWSYGKTGDFSCWRKKFGISEKFSQESIRAAGELHESAAKEVKGSRHPYGISGEIKLSLAPSWAPFESKFEKAFLRTAANVTGTRVNKDQNSDNLGFGKIVHAVEADTGYISSPVTAFFESTGVPDTLHIVTRHMVRKILFDTTASIPRATGVEFVHAEDKSGRRVYVKKASKRVILTAGAVRTPQLLTVSGVGSKSDLKRWKIKPVVTRNGVGQNLHDHYDIGNAAVCFPRGTKGYEDFGPQRMLGFSFFRRGQLRAPLGTQSYGFFNSKQKNLTTCPDPRDIENCRPDFELVFQHFGQNTQATVKPYLGLGVSEKHLQEDFYLQGRDKSKARDYLDIHFHQKDCIMMTPTMLHPEYRGQITLTSNNALDAPIVDLKTISNSRDMILIGELWQVIKKISNEAFGPIGGKFEDTPFSECKGIQDRDSFEFGRCQVERYLKSAWHLAGTCRIGRRDDPMAVVDESFHVIGVRNLVVADASLIPCPTSGHMLPTIASLAEMAAQELIAKFRISNA